MSKSTVTSSINLAALGKHIGDLRIKWSDNSVPLGYHPVPIISIKSGPGPVILMFGGTHGDEFEGPSALMRIVNDLQVEDITGQVIIVPGLNTPAVRVSSRVSPLDGQNLNRAFPGDPTGGVTDQIAHYVETILLPFSDAAVDLHSGGKASFFTPCTLATRTKNIELYTKNIKLAEAFGLPLIWVLGAHNDKRSLNSAAERAGVPMIATELGGGGGVDPGITDATEVGLYRLLRNLKVLNGDQPNSRSDKIRKMEVKSQDHSIFSDGDGIFDRKVNAGVAIQAGQIAGYLHYSTDPKRPSEMVVFPHNGFVLAHTNRGYVNRGDMLMLVVQNADDPDISQNI